MEGVLRKKKKYIKRKILNYEKNIPTKKEKKTKKTWLFKKNGLVWGNKSHKKKKIKR